MQLENNLASATSWDIHETQFDPDQNVTTGSNYMIGNGYLGYRGTFADARTEDRPACVLTDTYDRADETWKELVTAPNALFTEIAVNGTPCRWAREPREDYLRSLNFRYGEWSASVSWPARGISLREERFASSDDLHLLVSRTTITAERSVHLRISAGIDGNVWSLNGEHYRQIAVEAVEAPSTKAPLQLEARGVTGEHQYDVVVRELSRVHLDTPGTGAIPVESVTSREREIYRVYTLDLAPEERVVLTRYVVIYSSNDLRSVAPVTADARRGPLPSLEQVRRSAEDAVVRADRSGWDTLRAANQRVWDSRWTGLDIRIEGDPTAQTVLRYNLYHNIIATPAHADHLPIGARGLSCQAYQGAAFWDQEIFNLPMYLYTDPETARKILVYRYRTLDGARKKARNLGYRGAFYAWVSGDTGEEICPSWFFRDVISGRRIRNHFNDWQIHISPDIVYTIRKYVLVTGDREYLRQYGAEIVFEVARFLLSRVHYRRDRDHWEVLRVLGPDEYHENVDNNFFTNFQVRLALEYAEEVYHWLQENAPDDLARVRGAIGLEAQERDDWREVREKLFIPLPDPHSGVIEQFQGFQELEDTRPETVRERLVDPGEYWGWPNGIAVETQVSKQADVVQLFALHPEVYDRAVMRANWEYYEPRTQHGSSLSYGVYAITAAWIGHDEEAYRYFLRSCTVDLYSRGKSVSGGTFIGGIHTAACGIAWQIVVHGFLGMRPTAEGFSFDPHLPEAWSGVTVPLQRRGQRILVEARHNRIILRSDERNDESVVVSLREEGVHTIAPGREAVLLLS